MSIPGFLDKPWPKTTSHLPLVTEFLARWRDRRPPRLRTLLASVGAVVGVSRSTLYCDQGGIIVGAGVNACEQHAPQLEKRRSDHQGRAH
jgi:hypothetical protein